MIPVNVTYYDFACSLISVPEGRSSGVVSSDSLVVHHYWPNGTVYPSKMEHMQFPLGHGRHGIGLKNVTEIIFNKTSENEQSFRQTFSDSLKYLTARHMLGADSTQEWRPIKTMDSFMKDLW